MKKYYLVVMCASSNTIPLTILDILKIYSVPISLRAVKNKKIYFMNLFYLKIINPQCILYVHLYLNQNKCYWHVFSSYLLNDLLSKQP